MMLMFLNGENPKEEERTKERIEEGPIKCMTDSDLIALFFF